MVRAFSWLGAAALLGAALSAFGTRPSILDGAPGGALTWLTFGAAAITASAAALTAFRLSLPDRSSAWSLLPLPALVAWIVASGLGCLAARGADEAWGKSLDEVAQCVGSLVFIAVPLSALMLVMLRRAQPLRPRLALMLGGLASASAAAVLLSLVHPHPSTPLDLAAHAIAFGVIVVFNVSAERLVAPRAS